MVKVYAWPPVGVISSKWTRRTPVAKSRSLITGARYLSAMRRERIVASMRVGGRSFDYTGHGYMESLKRFLEGGENLVRLSEIVEPYPREFSHMIGSWPTPMEWRGPTNQVVTWQSAAGTTVTWMAGALMHAVVMSGTPRTIRIQSGLPPNEVVVRPGQRVLAVKMPDGPHFQAFSTQRVVSNSAGAANIRLNTEPGLDVTHAVLRFRESAVFEVEGPLPEVEWAVNEEPVWDWKFLQVFADEVAGGFEEEDPW